MKRFLKALGWSALVALLHTALFWSPWGQMLEHRALDLWFQIRGPVSPPSEIVVVAMDEDSYEALGFALNAAWPRAAHAALLRQMATNGARRVVFDVVFFDPGPSPTADDELAEAMQAVPTVIGAEVRQVDDQGYSKWTLHLPFVNFRHVPTGLVGHPIEDGYSRRFLVPEAMSSSNVTEGYASLASLASGRTNGPGPRDFIRFYGPPRTIRTYSYYQVFQNDPPLPAAIFRDKIVFVGKSLGTALGPSESDAFLTSGSRARMFGVEIHATAAANLLEGKWIRRGSVAAETWGLSLASALLTLGLLYLRPAWGALLTLGYAGVWSGIAFWSFQRGNYLPGAALAVVIMPVTFFGATLSNYFVVRLRERRLERAFKFYLSPEMAREVARNPQALELGGREVECTAMFTDIAGFTTVAEQMKPAEVSRMLNAYFTEVMDSMFDNRGTVIQFIGDGVYALWGAPLETSEHARLCCKAAQATHAAIERFNQTGRFPPLRTRFGINTGPVLVGNLGSTRRFDFTGIGDSVNLASRVEGLNKYFGTSILMTDSTRAQVPASVVSLKMGLIRAVGKTQPVGLHALLPSPLSSNAAAMWAEACARFVARDWPAAENLFSQIRQTETRLAKAADLYQKQIDLHRLSPPPTEWQGEIIFTSK